MTLKEPSLALVLYPLLFAALAVMATVAVIAGRRLLGWIGRCLGCSE